MEPRPEPHREATPTLRLRSPKVRRQRERVVGFEEAPNREGNRRGRNVEGIRPSEIEAREGENRGGHQPSTNMGGNLPPNGTLLSHHAQPFIPSSLHTPTGLVPTHVNPYSQPSVNLVHGQAPNFLFQTQMGNPPAGDTFTYQGGYIPQAFTNNSVPSYNGPMHPTVTPTNDTLQILGLHEEQRISGFVHGLRTRSLVEPLSTDLPSTYKGLIEKTYIWVEEREVATNGVSNDRRDGYERSKKSSWDNNKGQKNRDRFSPYRGPSHGLLPSLSKSPKENLVMEKAARSFEPPPNMFGSKRSRDTSKYCHFHKDYRHETNDCRHLRTQIHEAVNLGQLSHLVKGIKKERTKSSDTTWGERKEIIFPLVEKVNNAPVIIVAKIFKRKVGQVYMDSGSSCKIIYEHCIEKLNPAIKATRVDLKTPLVGFSRERSWSVGEVPLEITIGDAPLSRTETLNFVIVRFDSSQNMLLGRTMMQRMGIEVSTIHGAIKFHTEKGIGTVFSTDEADEGAKRAKKIPVINKERILNCVNAEEKIIVNDKYPNQTMIIRRQLPNHFKKELQNLLKSNAYVFAWTHTDMTGIQRTIMVEGKPFNTKHKLNEYNHINPIKQNKRANPVMVKKSDGGWRICVDFTDINKAYPKDCYPLPEIDWKIESLLGFRLKCFLDAYKGYHQIQMVEEDEDKTAFYVGEGVFCYKKMSFGLKNAGATYQWLMDKVFNRQIGRNLEAYVDDMVIKSTFEKEMLKDIRETLKRLRSINMKLNPKKCSFDVEDGPFLGHLITKHGIKANPSKVKAVTDLDQPRTLKDVQSLNGKQAAFSRFLSKGAERSLAFFKVLKG
ncbi:reverse transcriptase domain-containing protein [Tanacetum coccineum]